MTDDKLREVFGELPVVKCPPALAQRLAAIPDEPRRRTTVRWWAWATPLAAAAALAAVLIATRPPHYTEAEVAAARIQAVETVSTAMALIQRTQREAVSEVLGRQVPNTLRTSVQKALQLSEGGQG